MPNIRVMGTGSLKTPGKGSLLLLLHSTESPLDRDVGGGGGRGEKNNTGL